MILLFGGAVSSFTLNGILSQLGDLGEIPVVDLTPQSAAWLRRRVERLGRSYLAPESSKQVLQKLDALFAAAKVSPDAENASGAFPALSPRLSNTLRIGLIQPPDQPSPPAGVSTLADQPSPPTGVPTIQDLPVPTSTNSFRSPPPASTPQVSSTPIPKGGVPSSPMAPLIFSFRDETELIALQAELQRVLFQYLRDPSVVRRLSVGLERASRAALAGGTGEIRLERDAGLRGRLVFQVRTTNGQTCLSGAVFASVSSA